VTENLVVLAGGVKVRAIGSEKGTDRGIEEEAYTRVKTSPGVKPLSSAMLLRCEVVWTVKPSVTEIGC
jgi:hypothetical protein